MKRLTSLLLFVLLVAPMVVGVGAQEEDTAALVEGNSGFAFALYDQLRNDAAGNLLFSPFSVSQALAMTFAGAEGETEAQMAEVLGFTLPEPALHAAFSGLNDDLIVRGTGDADPDQGIVARSLHIANGLWAEETYPFSDEFIAELAEYYGAGLQEADFINEPEEAREEINGWVEEQTEDRIQDIVPEGAIDELTRLVLANAIYFYGGWADTFNEGNTSDDEFHLLDGKSVTVSLMFQQESFAFADGDGYQVVDIPYQGSGLTFTVILPDEGAFAAVEDGLDAAMLSGAVSELAFTEVSLYLPKFEFEFETSVSEALQSLGMTDAFDSQVADFTGMMGDSAPTGLSISDVLHKAFISLDEDGTEAAAATVVIMVGESAQMDPEEPVEVRIDRPFIFAIRDVETGSILFLGRVMDPTGA